MINLDTLPVNSPLPDYFESKLIDIRITSNHIREDLIDAERERYKVAAYIAREVFFDLKKVIRMAQESSLDQLIHLPELRNTSHLLDLRSPVLLSAIHYICHENEKSFVSNFVASELLAAAPLLPPYFARRVLSDPSLEEIFRQATQLVEENGFQLAAILERKKDQPTTKVALQAIRYACYVMEHPSEEKRYLTRKGSRIDVLQVH